MHKIDKKLVTWNDLQTANHHDLKRVYKINDKQLEMQVRYHLNGANRDDIQKVYKSVYNSKNK